MHLSCAQAVLIQPLGISTVGDATETAELGICMFFISFFVSLIPSSFPAEVSRGEDSTEAVQEVEDH